MHGQDGRPQPGRPQRLVATEVDGQGGGRIPGPAAERLEAGEKDSAGGHGGISGSTAQPGYPPGRLSFSRYSGNAGGKKSFSIGNSGPMLSDGEKVNSDMRPNSQPPRLLAAALVLLSAPALGAADLPAVQRAVDLSPERLAAFQRTLSEFGSELTLEHARSAGLDLQFRETYMAPIAPLPELGDDSLPAGVWGHALPVGITGRDLVFEEQFLMQGREEDFESAAKRWTSRAVKGSDAAQAERGSRFAPKFGWNDGPVVGFRKGPISASHSPDGWAVRYSRALPRHPGWVARVSAGMDDGHERIAFTIGRSLARSTSR